MLRPLALCLTLLTGFCGLVYEVAWQKYATILLGSQSEATAAILGIFLGGLSLGYALFGRLSQRGSSADPRDGSTRLLRLYGGVECGIGLYGLLFPLLFTGALSASALLPQLGSGAGFALDVALVALLIGPPSCLMGATIPVLTQALSRGLDDASRLHALVYGTNTAGAFAGAFAAGFFLVPWLGLRGVVWAMGALNLAAGAAFVVLASRAREAQGPAPPADAAPVKSFASYAASVLLLGFAMMAIQTVLNRIGALSFGASPFTFAIVAACYVLCIALGSLSVSLLRSIRAGHLTACVWLLFASLYLLYTRLPDAPYWAHVLRVSFRGGDAAFYPYYLTASACILLVLALPIGLSGAALPLLFHRLRHEVGDLGAIAGRLYGWNTLGSVLGALLGGYALLLVLDLHEVYCIALAATAIAATLLTRELLGVSWRGVVAVALVPALLALVLLPAWEPARLSAGLFRVRTPTRVTAAGPDALMGRAGSFLFHTDDPTASISVVELLTRDGERNRAILNNGKSDGSVLRDYTTMALLSLLPAVFAEHIERSFIIGYGTGISAGVMASLDGVREVVVAEISPGVIEAAPLFDPWNGDASRSPKLKLIRGDAYRALRRDTGRFDVIGSEPSNPWVTGVEMMFSREFLELARDRLTPGGVYVQWLQTYEMTADLIQLVLRTYATVFPHASVWYSQAADLLIVGFRDPERALDLASIEQRVRRPDIRRALARAGIDSLPELLAHELLPLGVLHAEPSAGEIHTLLDPILGHRAARAFFAGEAGPLPHMVSPAAVRVGVPNALLRRYGLRFGGELPLAERAQVLAQTCSHRPPECAVLAAAWLPADRSATLAGIVEGARKRKTFADYLAPDHLSALGALFGVDPPRGAVSLEEAEQATRRFAQHYHYPVPFDPAALVDVWRRCEGAGCERPRSEVEARWIGLGHEPPSTTD